MLIFTDETDLYAYTAGIGFSIDDFYRCGEVGNIETTLQFFRQASTLQFENNLACLLTHVYQHNKIQQN